MPLTQEQANFVDQYLELSDREILYPRPFATVLICATRDEKRGVGPVEVLKRLWSAQSHCEYDIFSLYGAPEERMITLNNKQMELGLDCHFLKNTDSPGNLMNHLSGAEALVLAYDDTNRESFEALSKFHETVNEFYKAWLGKKPAQSESHWHKLKRHLRRALKNGQQDAAASAGPEMDPGPIPKVVIGNRCTDRPCVVSREEGDALAKKLGAEFYMISTQKLNWGDCDVLELLAPRLVYRRACGIEKGQAMSGNFPERFE
ncbi:hypothetical protein B0J13DRAFT_560692 [Dactylonectria estremocensis]|uniref:Uncharacterized protein n=1 Tax=Dactylonectria estremocensis TaxID=1079267 RepID=A0A9P9IV16_9HYPO|nr:hypothetical protein B0J13DRAFT_560692 [Dactylonectria estremocensis]